MGSKKIPLATRKIRDVESVLILSGSGSVCLSNEGIEHYQSSNDQTWEVFFRAVGRDLSKELFIPDNTYRKNATRLSSFRSIYYKMKSERDYLARDILKSSKIEPVRFESLNLFPRIREEISHEFRHANEYELIKLRIHDLTRAIEMIPSLQRGYLHANVTTNWDRLLLKEYKNISPSNAQFSPLHEIHGSFENEHTIYLPMDHVYEELNIRLAMDIKHPTDRQSKSIERFCKHLRPQDSILELARTNGNIFHCFEKADLVIVCGLAFNDDDVEASAIVSTALDTFKNSGRFPKFILLDPEKSTRDRLCQIFRIRKENRFDFDPNSPSSFEIFDMKNI
jgi:hypothetical protein